MPRAIPGDQTLFLLRERHRGTPYADASRLFQARFPGFTVPARQTYRKIEKKVEQHFVLTDRRSSNPGRPVTTRTFENTVAILGSVMEDPNLSTRRRAAALDIGRGALMKILKKDLKQWPYRYTLHQGLKPQDLPARVNLANWILLLEDFYESQGKDFIGHVWWSDEAKFCLHGTVNSHNAVHWGTSRPDPAQKPPRDSPKLNVWVAICQYGYIGPFFFKDQQGATVNVDGARYLEMLENFFIPALFNFYTRHDLDPSQFWFMQDGARCHITRNPQVNVIDYIGSQFGAQTIGEKLGEHWPARSPDLTPCDFFLWGYIKEEVYKQGPQPNLAALETAIRVALQRTPANFFFKACNSSIPKRMEELRKRCGGHIEHSF